MRTIDNVILDRGIAALGGLVARRATDEVEAEIAAAEGTQHAARGDARDPLHAEVRTEREDAVQRPQASPDRRRAIDRERWAHVHAVREVRHRMHEAAQPDADPGESLERVLHALARLNAGGNSCDERQRVRASLLELLRRAQRLGELRTDVDPETLLRSLGGLVVAHLSAGAAASNGAGVVVQLFLDAAGYRPRSRANTAYVGA